MHILLLRRRIIIQNKMDLDNLNLLKHKRGVRVFRYVSTLQNGLDSGLVARTESAFGKKRW